MTIEQAIEQLDWYFKSDDGLAADTITKEAYERLKEPYCVGIIKDSSYKLEKPKLTGEDIEKMSFDEKLWFLVFLLLATDKETANTVSINEDVNEMIKKFYSMA
jgi:hypothetical protein